MTELLSLLTSGWGGWITALVAGTFVGFIAGLTPGLGGRISIILCLPLAIFWDPLGAAVFLFAMHAVIHTATSIPAIAFALPSTSGDAATILDGHPLAKMGRGGEALGASLSASALGGVLGAIAFLLCIPIARALIAWFGPPEFLVLAVAGLSMVVTLSGRSLVTGFLVALLGLLLAMVGRDVTVSAGRFTFGVPELLDGLSLAAFVGGIFAVPEMLSRFEIEGGDKVRAIETRFKDVLRGMWTTFRYIPLVIRSSIYGIVVGIMPGVGSSVSVWMSYDYAARTVKSDIPFGKGAIAGVIAPEAANNSKEGGAMVPTLFFGIPGSSSMAIMLLALHVVGQEIGPNLLTTNIHVSLVLAATILLANLLAVPFFFAAVPWIVRLTALRRQHLVPIAIAISLFASMMEDMNMATLVQFAAGGVLGVALKWVGWPRAPFLLGFVLGPIAELSYIQTTQIWGWAMFLRPMTLAMVALFGFGILRSVLKRRPAVADTALGKPDGLVAALLLLIFCTAFLMTLRLPAGASPAPLIVTSLGMALAALAIVRSVWPTGQKREALERFDWLGTTTLFALGVPIAGLPAASAIYTIYLLTRMKVRPMTAIISAAILAGVQLGLLSLVLDLRAEPLVQGYLLWWMEALLR
ncbi:MAG: hypothetical protein EOP22_12315 [Hyphomicrobiales bacterium]|nr:MAG: hypothetical protein EOP22_12315 [Hyphomicrobiales bacterium]